MAKAFSVAERERIRNRLLQAAEDCMNAGGIRKTSVDELATAAGISKGAFYIFYPAKEELFFDVILRRHEQIENEMTTRLSAFSSPGPTDLVAVLLFFFRETAASFFPKLIGNGELELLMRKLPPEVVSRHKDTDAEFIGRVTGFFPDLSGVPVERYAAAFRAIFLLLLHREVIGEEYFDEVLEMLISGAVDRMFAEGRILEEEE